MSVFRVKLNNVNQGLLDVHPTTGVQQSTSIQRTVYVMGPNKTNRLLTDGEQFTDCNYWKRFAYPTASYETAFIEVVTDDGGTWVDGTENAATPGVWDPGTSGTIAAGAGPDDTNMSYDFVATDGGPASFIQINNMDSSDSIQAVLNDTATFTVEANSIQVFNDGDLQISKLSFDNSASGTPEVATVQVVFGIAPSCNS